MREQVTRMTHISLRTAKPVAMLGFVAAMVAGCVQPTTTAPVTTAPPTPAPVQRPQVATPAPTPAPVAPTTPAAPAQPTRHSGPVDSRTGLQQAALVSISGDVDSRYIVLLRPAQANPGQVEAAPAKLCGQDGRSVDNSKTNSPGSGAAMPGVQIMIVECSAA